MKTNSDDFFSKPNGLGWIVFFLLQYFNNISDSTLSVRCIVFCFDLRLVFVFFLILLFSLWRINDNLKQCLRYSIVLLGCVLLSGHDSEQESNFRYLLCGRELLSCSLSRPLLSRLFLLEHSWNWRIFHCDVSVCVWVFEADEARWRESRNFDAFRWWLCFYCSRVILLI